MGYRFIFDGEVQFRHRNAAAENGVSIAKAMPEALKAVAGGSGGGV